MAASVRRPARIRGLAARIRGLAAAALLAAVGAALATPHGLHAEANLLPAGQAQLPINLEAQSAEFDYANNSMLYHKVKISQGAMSVAADLANANGQSTNVNFEDSKWVFRGNVKIQTDQGLLTAEEADVTFLKGVLVKALITGKPAEFEQRAPKSGKRVIGHAEVIEYDVAKNTIQLSKDAWLSNGPDEIHGESLKYNLIEKKMFADPGEQNSQRVHITITPPPPAAKP
jgi:lipopolysaccharide transport protein LptA